ncbi:MAG: tRNA-dependent lipid II--amino acid ligase, partial [uncultured Nocardioides sp.]
DPHADDPSPDRVGAPRVRGVPALDELPADPGVGGREVGVAGRVAGLQRGRRAARRCARALPPAAEAAPLPRLPAGRTRHRLGRRRPRGVAGPAGRPPEEQPRLRDPHGSPRRHPAMVRRAGQGGHRGRVGQPPGRRAPDRALAGGRPGRRPAAGARLAAPVGRGRVLGRAAPVQLPGPAGRAVGGGRARRHEPAVAPQHQEGRQGRRRHPTGRPRGPPGVPRPLRPHRRARPLHAPSAVLLRDDVRRPRRRGARADLALAGRARGGPRRVDDLDPRRHPRLVLLRRLLDREARRAGLQRGAVGDGARRHGRGRTRLRPPRDHRDARRRRPSRGADPVQGRHRRRGRRVRRGVGPAAQPPALPGVRPLHEEAVV